MAKAIEFYISGDNLAAHIMLSEAHNKLSASEEAVMLLRQKLSNLTDQIAEKYRALESSSSDVKRIVKLQEMQKI